jgi:hypothetical protein
VAGDERRLQSRAFECRYRAGRLGLHPR